MARLSACENKVVFLPAASHMALQRLGNQYTWAGSKNYNKQIANSVV